MLLSLLSKRSLDVGTRDAYGFTVRPQNLQTYREYAGIYKEEEEERLKKWNFFVKQQEDPTPSHPSAEANVKIVASETTEKQSQSLQKLNEGDGSYGGGEPGTDIHKENDGNKLASAATTRTKYRERRKWVPVRQSLNLIESMMSSRIRKRKHESNEWRSIGQNLLPTIGEGRDSGEGFGQACEEVGDRSIDFSCHSLEENYQSDNKECPEILSFSKEELEFLVQGGVPRDLRGEVWQAFVGVKTRRIEKYYFDLLDSESAAGDDDELNKSESGEGGKGPSMNRVIVPEKVRKQIEKDLTRTFPGHPALDEDGRDSLRRLLLAYARHNPSVGYCQAMNFFAGILLLMMPEENAFWALVAVIDDYFDGYYTHEMIESQVDQLVFEDLVRERFPKLVNHLDYLGVQVTWISGPWFLSIFVNMLPWESVLRIWDVMLFEGNRVMLFRTALALLEFYGPAIVTTQDTADAISLLQALATSTFDSSQLVLTACMGFLNVTEDRLRLLRDKHRPSIVGTTEERPKGARGWKDVKGLAKKMYSFKHHREPLVREPTLEEGSREKISGGVTSSKTESADMNKTFDGFDIDSELDSLSDIQDQVDWLKAELSRLLEEKRNAVLRAEELEAALMEMVKQDNRRELSVRVEQLEQEVGLLRQLVSEKGEQESALIQVMMRVEHEQKLNEDARILAQQDAAAQRHALQVLQEKYDIMEKRVVMAESMLEATLQYESSQTKAQAQSSESLNKSPRPDSPAQNLRKTAGLLSFGLGWRDKNKEKKNISLNNEPASEGVETSSAQNRG